MTQLDASQGARLQRAKRPRVGYFTIRTVVSTSIAIVLAAIFIWPFLCVLGQSFNRMDVWLNPLLPWPKRFSTKLYGLMVTRYKFNRYILNSVLVSVSTVVLSVFASSLAGYALAKLEFPGRDILFGLILAIMLLPTQTMLIPRFVVMREFKLVNSYWGLILPSVGGGAFGIFLMRQFMMQVPTEMLEAARIDGSSEFGLFAKIVLPTMLAPIGVLATLSLRGSWNALLWPQILITDESKMLLMPALIKLNDTGSSDVYAQPTLIAAAITAAIVPLGLYAYSQRYFVATMTGAIKG